MRVRVLPGVPISMGMWFNPNSRGSRLRIWQPWGCNSLHAHQLRRLASEGIADPGDLKSPSLPGASPGSPTNLRSSSCGSASRRVVNREQQTGSTQDRTALGVQVSPRRPMWNVNRASEPGLGANECMPTGKWCKSTAFRQPLQAATNTRVVESVASAGANPAAITNFGLQALK